MLAAEIIKTYPYAVAQELGMFAANAMYGAANGHSLYSQGIDLARQLGYTERIFPSEEGFGGLSIYSGSVHDMRYIPGVNSYTPEDHVKGLAHLVAGSRIISREVKSQLIASVVDIAAKGRERNMLGDNVMHEPLMKDRVEPVLSRRAAEKAAVIELEITSHRQKWYDHPESPAAVATGMRDILHPNRRAAIAIAAGVIAFGLKRASKRRTNRS